MSERPIRRIAQLLVCLAAGLGLAWAASLDVPSLSHAEGYRWGAHLLLTIGLYGAASSIDLHQARTDNKLIVAAVTIGVIVKALLIGGSLSLAWHNPLFFVLGIAVAQIDPLSVAARIRDDRMSTRARTVLAAWSSLDDPCTVVLAIYAAAVAATTFGARQHPALRHRPAAALRGRPRRQHRPGRSRLAAVAVGRPPGSVAAMRRPGAVHHYHGRDRMDARDRTHRTVRPNCSA